MTTPHPNVTAPAAPVSEPTARRLIAVLYQHRMATTAQLLALHPVSRWVLMDTLNQLRRDDLVERTGLRQRGRTWVWFLTPAGVDAAAGWPEVAVRARYTPVTPATAALHSAHTLTVLRCHLAFTADAAARGDEHGPLDFIPEVTHRLPDVGDERLRPDALLYYTVNDAGGERSQMRAFIEVDRGTMASERLSRKLISYARFYHHRPMPPPGRRPVAAAQTALPTWQHFYPRYPRVLMVLTGTSSVTHRNRVNDLMAMVAGHPLVAAFAKVVPLGAARLEDLETHGARGPVWMPLDGRGEPTSWTEL